MKKTLVQVTESATPPALDLSGKTIPRKKK